MNAVPNIGWQLHAKEVPIEFISHCPRCPSDIIPAAVQPASKEIAPNASGSGCHHSSHGHLLSGIDCIVKYANTGENPQHKTSTTASDGQGSSI
jgi:hypothetical protein